MRWIVRSLAAVIGLPVIFYCAGLIGGAVQGKLADVPAGADQFIGLVRGPIHYDLMLPMTPELRAHFGFAQAAGVPMDNPNVEWLIVGWGARAFYTSTVELADIAPVAVLQGVFGDSSVVHLDVAGNLRGVDAVQFLPVSDAQMTALLTEIDRNFSRDQAGQPVALRERFSNHDAFFAGTESFNIFYTCNAWIGHTLRAAGVPFGIWTPTPQSIEISLKRLSVN